MSKRKFSVIELFAGAGGLALGFEEGGFETKLLVENWKYACKTLKTNRHDWEVLCEGVENVDWSGYKAKDYNGIDEFFGNHNWADRIKKYEEDKSSSRPQVDAFLDEFCDALKRFGYLVEYQEVTSIETNAPVYYMVFAVSNDNAHAIVKRMMQGITKAKEKWIAETQAKITKVDGVGLSGRTLSGWVPATKRKLTDWMD